MLIITIITLSLYFTTHVYEVLFLFCYHPLYKNYIKYAQPSRNNKLSVQNLNSKNKDLKRKDLLNVRTIFHLNLISTTLYYSRYSHYSQFNVGISLLWV